MDLKNIGHEAVDWLLLAQDRISDRLYEHNNEPSGFIKGEEFLY
jgi:hypothetical protein